ncbi:hypothetical protein HMPREF1051_0098 [Neisseria sicca VK64]|uniref:Uncharacterized protein n=1 Tax=Neisseria sicca VK64 TaxID=1095748 RepID=I2NE59_NEISI|nr:hypothetical protein HMPREF1051_0098 [Neisseria sicca VK64]
MNPNDDPIRFPTSNGAVIISVPIISPKPPCMIVICTIPSHDGILLVYCIKFSDDLKS